MRDDALREQIRHGLRHREIGLARARRADAEHDVELIDRLEIAPLRDALRRHLLAAGGRAAALEEILLQLDVRILREQLRRRLHVAAREPVAARAAGRRAARARARRAPTSSAAPSTTTSWPLVLSVTPAPIRGAAGFRRRIRTASRCPRRASRCGASKRQAFVASSVARLRHRSQRSSRPAPRPADAAGVAELRRHEPRGDAIREHPRAPERRHVVVDARDARQPAADDDRRRDRAR